MATKEELLVKLGSSNIESAIAAAEQLMYISIQKTRTERQSPILDCAISAIIESVSNEAGLSFSFGKNKTITSFISLNEIRKNIANEDSILIVALERAFSLDRKTQTIDSKKIVKCRPLLDKNILLELHKTTITTKRTSEVLKRLRDGYDVALIGQSASGKTITAAQVSAILLMEGWTVTWLELSDPERSLFDILIHLIQSPNGSTSKHLIILDDIQSNPSEATKISQIINFLSDKTNSKIHKLLLGWYTVTNLIKETYPRVMTIVCNGEELLFPISKAILRDNYNEEIFGRIRLLSRGDLLIAKLAMDIILKDNRIPSYIDVADFAYKYVTKNSELTKDAIVLLYFLSAIGQFEIEASKTFAESKSHIGFTELLEKKIVRKNGEFISVGHRTLSSMIVQYISMLNKSIELMGIEPPIKIAADYLRNADNKQILATLERLDLVSLSIATNDQHGTVFLARAWLSFQILVNYLKRQAGIDPSWGDNLASAIFAAEAFAEISHDDWFEIARFIRSRWKIPTDGSFPNPAGGPTAERIDFDEIYKRMREEDFRLGKNPEGEDGADTIDLERAHLSWLLGLLLGFEGKSPEPNYNTIEALKKCAAKVQKPNGSFYPSRIPWITARAVLGLYATGESIRSSQLVRDACNWLRRAYPDGAYRLGLWESGTGTWNTTLMTTAMCVLALVRAGVPCDDTAVSSGTAYILSKRDDWVRPGKEIDGALAIETILLVKGNWRELSKELSHILSWAKDREPWTRPNMLASDSQDESSKVPFIANSLINIVWETVKAELPLLLEGLSINIQHFDLPFMKNIYIKHYSYIVAQSIQEIKRIIDKNIADRQSALKKMVSTSDLELEKGLKIWRERLSNLTAIEITFNDVLEDKKKATTLKNGSNIIERLNNLGLECFGNQWEPLENRIKVIL